jgi:hypothetical protein
MVNLSIKTRRARAAPSRKTTKRRMKRKTRSRPARVRKSRSRSRSRSRSSRRSGRGGSDPSSDDDLIPLAKCIVTESENKIIEIERKHFGDEFSIRDDRTKVHELAKKVDTFTILATRQMSIDNANRRSPQMDPKCVDRDVITSIRNVIQISIQLADMITEGGSPSHYRRLMACVTTLNVVLDDYDAKSTPRPKYPFEIEQSWKDDGRPPCRPGDDKCNIT